ncbi:hypothetical protein CVO74_22345 [Xanthomonas prunicola]|nr:hypothetical protein CVO74_22345 [Xanthomonas prunicola]
MSGSARAISTRHTPFRIHLDVHNRLWATAMHGMVVDALSGHLLMCADQLPVSVTRHYACALALSAWRSQHPTGSKIIAW